MQTPLFVLGLVLFVLGLATGLVIPALKNPRMGLASHLQGMTNGPLLIIVGLLWPHLVLPHVWQVVTVALLAYGAYANWLATQLAAIWGAGRKFAPGGIRRQGGPRQLPAGVAGTRDDRGQHHSHRRRAAVTMARRVSSRVRLRRVTPLIYFTDDDRVIMVASNYGSTRHPAWYYNVTAHPTVTLCAGGFEGRFVGQEAIGADYDRLWARAKQWIPVYDMYEASSGNRRIPLVAFAPIS